MLSLGCYYFFSNSKFTANKYAIILTTYILDSEFLIQNQSYFTNIIILQAKHFFIYLFIYFYIYIYINYLFIYLYIRIQ
jgi:hypothetical protein